MKKFLIGLLACLCIGTTSLGFAGCNVGGNTGGGSSNKESSVADSEKTFDSEEKNNENTSSGSDGADEESDFSIENSESEESNASVDDSEDEEKQELLASEGLEYTLSEDETYYIVTGIGICRDTDIVIPSIHNDLPVTTIGSHAFSHYSRLTSVVIPDSVTIIGSHAFSSCNSLTKIYYNATECLQVGDGVFTTSDGIEGGIAVVIGANVKSIPAYLFGVHPYSRSGSKICSVKFEEGSICKSIGDSAFFRCYNLTEIVLPASVTSIGNSAFAGCYNLTEIVIPDSVTSIGEYTFGDCQSLTEIIIPDSVTSIGKGAFYYCCSLTEIVVNENNTAYQSIDGNLYTKDGGTLVQYAIGKTNMSFIIPDGVTSIGDNAFDNCKSLTNLVIPDSVISIGWYAFSYCDSLTSITFNGTVEEWNAIEKRETWNDYVPATEVVCTDGTVAL